MKISKLLLLSCLLSAIVIPSQSHAYGNESGKTELLEARTVVLSPEVNNSKGYELEIQKSGDQVIYGFKDVPVEDRKEAMKYLNSLIDARSTQTPSAKASLQSTSTIDLTSNGSYYGNNFGEDSRNGNAQNYSFVNLDFNVGFWTATMDSTGGQSASWFGTGNPTQIVFNESASYSGVSVTVGWPPSATGSSTSKSWSSQPVTGNPASATHAPLHASSATGIYSATFSDTADIYLSSTIYRPTTYIKFNYVK